MQSPQAPHDGPLDRDHLRRMALGDLSLEREVLTMFVAQASRIVDALAARPSDAKALVHTLKGSARAIGAFAVADHALALETAIGARRDPSQAAAELKEAVAEARGAIEGMLG